jgi:uncharacterized repeat protein (TIGR02543 family)
MRKKKFSLVLSVMLAIMLVFTMAPVSSSAANPTQDTTVYFTYQADDSGFAMAKQPVKVHPGLANEYGYSYGSNVKSTDITALDALVAAHILYLKSNDADAVKAKLEVSSYGFVTAYFGENSPNNLFFVNGKQPNDKSITIPESQWGPESYSMYAINQSVIKTGDVVSLVGLRDSSGMDNYVYFEYKGAETNRIVVAAGENIELTVKGYCNWYCSAVPSALASFISPIGDAAVVPFAITDNHGWNSTIFDGAIGVSGKNGKVSFTAPEKNGTYYYSAIDASGNMPVISPWLEIKVANKHAVAFNANGGKLSGTATGNVFETEPYGTLPTTTRTGYAFAGWYTSKSGGSKITAAAKVTAAKDITLYAHWTAKNYTLKFNANGGKVAKASKKVTFATKYGALPTPKNTNKSFAGWYTKKSGGAKVTSGKKFNIAKNITLYAHWSNSKIKITNCKSVYVHSGPGNSYKNIAVLKKGAKVKIISQKGTWYKVKSANGKVTGWLDGKYIGK